MLQPKPPSPVPSTPIAPPTELKSVLLDAVNEIFGGEDGVYTPEDKDRLLEGFADAVNVKVDIPWIGERVERAMILLLLKVVMRMGERFARQKLEEIAVKIG